MSRPAPGFYFLLLTIGIFCALLVPTTFMQGIFVDGQMYSTIAYNMSIGNGSLWEPVILNPRNSFHEHPPLALWLQSKVYDILGAGRYVDKVYSLLMAFFHAVLIAMIWRRCVRRKEYQKFYWLPILLWVTTPKCYWSFSNNMLENTLSLFSLAAVYSLIHSLDNRGSKKSFFICLASLLLLFAFLSKGFPGLYPLAFFLCFYVGHREHSSFRVLLSDSSKFLISSLILFFLFFYFFDAARANIEQYYEIQVRASLAGERVTTGHFYILKVIAREILPMSILMALVIFIDHRWELGRSFQDQSQKSMGFFFLLLGFSASLPIMVSPKQLSFYLVPAIPLFALAMSFLMIQSIVDLIERIDQGHVAWKLFRALVVILMALSILSPFYTSDYHIRNEEVTDDIIELKELLLGEEGISIGPGLQDNWTLMCLLERRTELLVDRYDLRYHFVLGPKDAAIPDGYRSSEVELQFVELWLLE